MSATSFLHVRFFADRAAIVALLRHEARISRAYQALRRRHLWHAIVWALVLSCAVGALVYARDAGVREALGAMILSAILWSGFIGAVLSPKGFNMLIDAMIRRRIERHEPHDSGVPCTVMLLDEGIVCEGAESTLALWSEVERISPEEDGLYIDLTSGRVLGVPHEAFRTNVEYRQFVEFACGRIADPP